MQTTTTNKTIVDKLNAIKLLNLRKERIEYDLQLLVAAKEQIHQLDPNETGISVSSMLVKFYFKISPETLATLIDSLEADCNNKLQQLISEAEALMK